MTARSGKLRPRAHLPRRQLAVLVLMCVVMGSLTFLSGLLVGRHWARTHPQESEAGKDRRPALARGGGLKDRELGRPPQIQEKLTFYHTLTAPLPSTPPRPASKPPDARTRITGAENEQGGAVKSEAPLDGVPTRGQPWTVQVAAYRSRDQAVALQRSLADAGYDTYVTSVTGQDGTVRYRVRVGSYPSRGEADKVSERLRAERALAPLIVPW